MEINARTPYPPEILGKPSKSSARAALKAHLQVGKGEPLRLSLSNALKQEKGLGGQERRFVALCTRELSRHQRWLDLAARLLGHPPGEWALAEDRALVRYVLWRRLFTGASWKDVAPEVKLPGPLRPRSVLDPVLERVATAEIPSTDEPANAVERAAIEHSFPNWLAERIAAACGEERIAGVLSALNEEPDLWLRVRPGSTREELSEALSSEGVETEPATFAPSALRVLGAGMKVFDTRAMKGGRVQLQEPGSQLIAALAQTTAANERAGLRVADVCAGAGGKTLALADAVGAGGKVFAGDLSKKRLEDARRRVREYGVSNVAFPEPIPLEGCDAVVIDAPCSGVGSLGREPDQKWKLSAKKIEEFARTQQTILEETAARVRSGAVIVYATCSLLREENEEVVEAFLASHPEFELQPAADVLGGSSLKVVSGPYLRVWPDVTHSAGFFAARLVRRAPTSAESN